MSVLKLYYHPLASYCWKALIALYENNTPFLPVEIDLFDPASAAQLERVWPMKRFPVLEDANRNAIVPESSMVIEYLTLHYPGEFLAIPGDGDGAIEIRTMDRIFDGYVMTPMQAIVADRIRPADAKDPFGVAAARELLATSYAMLETRLAGRNWAAGDSFTLADCSAAPSLYYANKVQPFGTDHPILTAYLHRLEVRPSFARVLKEAEPYLKMFPAG
jgi:glutathione S-transferase